MTLPATQTPPTGNVAPLNVRRCIGVDLSLSATGIAGDSCASVVVKPKTRGMERLHEISEAVIKAALYPFPPALVVIEGYSMGTARQSSHAHALGELGGVVRYRLHEIGVKWIDVPPSSLKLFGASKGNASKADMLDASRRCGYEGSNDDNAVDAWFLRQFGLYIHGAATVPATAYRDKATAAFRVAAGVERD